MTQGMQPVWRKGLLEYTGFKFANARLPPESSTGFTLPLTHNLDLL